VDNTIVAAVVPGAVHELSTGAGSFIHDPGTGHPQSCPQMWVERARTATDGDRPVTAGQ
jgi:hypothetical protein